MPGTGEGGGTGSPSLGASAAAGKTDTSNEGQVQDHGNLQQGLLTEPEKSRKATERK